MDGPEPATSSSRTRSRWTAYVGVWPYVLVRAFVLVGMGEFVRRPFARSSPRFLPMLGRLPGWAGIPSRKLRGLVASGARWVAVLGRAPRSRPGPGAEPRPPEAVSGW